MRRCQDEAPPALAAPTPHRSRLSFVAYSCADPASSALEATQRQTNGFFSQLSYKCYLEEVAFVGD